MTPNELSTALGEIGLGVSTRTLKDWRRRGLLPPLTKLSRGRGQGIERRWTSPTILTRAAVARSLLDRLEIVDEALFALASVGYFVEPAILKKAWLSKLDRSERKIAAYARRKKDGVHGLLSAEPPQELIRQAGFQGSGFPQLIWELERAYRTGEPIDEDEAYELIQAALSSFGLGASADEQAEQAEMFLDMIQSLYFSRDWERHTVLKSRPIIIKKAQIALNLLYRAIEGLNPSLKIVDRNSHISVLIYSTSMSPFLLKTSLYLAEAVPTQKLFGSMRQLEDWSLQANFNLVGETHQVPMPTMRTRAKLRRVCRDVFGAN